MGSRRRLSSESSFASLSSSSPSTSLSSYDDPPSAFSESEEGGGREKTPKSGSLLDDVKVILSKHDRKLLKVEDDVNFMVRWLNEKFGFILKHGSGSISSIASGSGVEELDNENEVAVSDGGKDDIDDVFYDDSISTGNQETIKESLTPHPPSDADKNDGLNGELKTNATSDVEERLSTSSESNNEGSDEKVETRLSPQPTHSIRPRTRQLKLEDIVSTSTSKGFPRPTITPRPQQRWKQTKISLPRKPKDASELPGGPSQCDICGKFLKDPNSLRQHKQIHMDIRPFNCPEPGCGKSFRRKFHLQTHSLIHKGVKKHQCGYCGRLFLLQKDLVSHERIHTGERPFKCRDCPKSFNLKSHLVMHVRTHTGERPYSCDICSKCFAQPNSLRLHKMKVHKNQNSPSTSSKQPKSPNKSTPRLRKSKNSKKFTQTSMTIVPISNSNINSGVSSGPAPGKLPIYRNQGTMISSFANIPQSTPVLTFVQQQPALRSHPIEILEPFNVNVNNAERIFLSQSSIINGVNILSRREAPATFITSEILDIP